MRINNLSRNRKREKSKIKFFDYRFDRFDKKIEHTSKL